MRSEKMIKTAKIGCILVSCALCLLGIAMIAFPDFSASALSIVCGVLMLLFGAARLIGYFSRDLYRLAFQFDLTSGVLAIVLGIELLARPGSLMTFLCVAIGFFILTDGLFKVQIALQSKQFGISTWWLTMIFAVLSTICGFLLMLHPGEGSMVLTILIGVTLLSEGILSLCTMLTAVKIIKNQQPDVIEVTDYRESAVGF